jgi:hypothetical protein
VSAGAGVRLVVVGPVAVTALVGAAAGACCGLVLGGSLDLVGRHLEKQQARRDAETAQLGHWRQALLEVAARNARLITLQAATEQIGGTDGPDTPTGPARPSLPGPLALADQTIAELIGWCYQVDAQLTQAEEWVHRHLTRTLIGRATGKGTSGALASAEEVLDDVADSAGDLRRKEIAEATATLERILARLAVNCLPQDREMVQQAATRVLGARTLGQARILLDDVRARIGAANARAEQARVEATTAAALLQPLLGLGAESTLLPRLQDVAAGRAPLDAYLHQEALHAAEEAKAGADRRYVHCCLTESLAELGYVVDEGFQTQIPVDGTLHVVHEGWTAHGVQLRLDDADGQMQTLVVRTAGGSDRDAERLDRERETQWCATLDHLRERLAERGISYQVNTLVAPGERPTPRMIATSEAQPPGTAASTATPQVRMRPE